MSAFLEVDYRFPPGAHAEKQAQALAIGQTAGSWDARHAHREAELRGHLGEIRALQALEDGSSLATIAFPLANVDGGMGSLLTMIFGKYSLGGTAKVWDLRLPEDYGLRPRFGLAGIRQRVDVFDRPLFMAIFKPALGLSAEDHAAILAEVAWAGLDIIKDDEILPNLAAAPTLERWRACAPIVEARRDRFGRDLLYAVNLSGDAASLQRLARQLVAEGANALLLNVLAYGFPVLEALVKDPEISVPIFAHPALAGALAAAPEHGLRYAIVLGTLMAHAGADAVLYPAHYGSLPFPAAEEFAIRDALRQRGLAPVPSAGIQPGILPDLLQDYGTEVILNAGTGIMDHPDGAASGVRAFYEAWERVQAGEPFTLDAVPPGPLQAALAKWGRASG
ncbi:RuBisCO large subunit C-terminal-like domain-containing protein [Candidatus Igneacidithiobacillus taiwanensis]|uniref:RuBisCO large subunit C-terminal-like domain-containing protein n=1 Tax=Candidatus Igneacidithiobacillus taiwanensis TaxID=1945924 RepID=UPI0028A11787|nr:RuBisCO large subunit C-terminal-like domain-containing protein [Candidatus Igneacidithiobacillus taiwanensis]